MKVPLDYEEASGGITTITFVKFVAANTIEGTRTELVNEGMASTGEDD